MKKSIDLLDAELKGIYHTPHPLIVPKEKYNLMSSPLARRDWERLQAIIRKDLNLNMKYKVGDRVRMNDGDLVEIKHLIVLLAFPQQDAYIIENLTTSHGEFIVSGYSIQNLVISDITDELIDRFKNEKIAWHFKKKEDYVKVLDMLEDKGMEFNRYENHPELLFTTEMKDFNIRYDSYCLSYEDYLFFKEAKYEIIEIMNPIYVPLDDVIEQEVYGMRYNDDVRLKSGIIKPMYKDIDCEVMFQQYGKNVRQGQTIAQLLNDIEQLKKENADLKWHKENMMKDLDKMTFQLSRIAGIVDEDL